MILHNVETNEEIWDYKATDKDLIRVVKDNIVGLDGIEAKERAVREREQEWEKLVRDRSHTNDSHFTSDALYSAVRLIGRIYL